MTSSLNYFCPHCKHPMDESDAAVYVGLDGELASAFMLNQICTRCPNPACEKYRMVVVWQRGVDHPAPILILEAPDEAMTPVARPLGARLLWSIFRPAILRGLRAW